MSGMTNNRQRRPRRLLSTLVVLTLALVMTLSFNVLHREARRDQHHHHLLMANSNEFRQVRNFELAATGAGISKMPPQIIKVGLEITNIYNLSIPNQTFMANGYFWLSWPETVQRWLKEEDIEIDQLIDFINNIVSYDFKLDPITNKPRTLANGQYSQEYSFSGHFFSEKLDFIDFPFQTLAFPIRIEISPDEFALNGNKPIALVADPQQPNLLGSLIDIPGLVLKGGKLEPYLHRYYNHTSGKREISDNVYSQVMGLAAFNTHPLASIGQWLIPIMIVMLTVFLAPNISGKLSELRIAIPSAALLTLVVMQQGFEETIPQLSYLTFLDLTYLWCYAITIALFVLFVWSANQWASIEVDDSDAGSKMQAMNARINRMDRRFQIFSVLATVVFMLLALSR